MLHHQTDLRQTGIAIINMDGLDTTFPLFTSDHENEICDILELTHGKLSEVIGSSSGYLNSILNTVGSYREEHEGVPPKRLVSYLRTGMMNSSKSNYDIFGYC